MTEPRGRDGSGWPGGRWVRGLRSPAMSVAKVDIATAGRARAVAVLTVVASAAIAVWLEMRQPRIRLAGVLSVDMAGFHPDFETFWHSAVAFTEGTDIYQTPAKLINLNSPLVSVLLAPLAGVPLVTAYWIMVALTVVMVLGAVLAVARELRLSGRVRAAVVGAVLVSSPLHGTLILGQIYGVLLVGLVAGWIAERRGRPVLSAVLFGVTVALKPSLAPMLMLPLALRRWSSLWAGMGAAAGATLVGVLLAGLASSRRWLGIVSHEPVRDHIDNASLAGLAVRFGLPSTLGLLLGVVVFAGTLGWIARHRDRIDPAGTAPWAVLAAAMLCSPITWHNYLLLLWPGVLVLLQSGRWHLPAVLLAAQAVPVSWSDLWQPEAPLAELGQSLYCAMLAGTWLAFVCSANGLVSSRPSTSSRVMEPAGWCRGGGG
jgi:alpha-1,2-mannosyltransferase